MKEQFKVTIFKYVETDNYENGVTESGRDLGLIQTFTVEHFSSLLGQLSFYYDLNNPGINETLENMENYLSFSRHENEDSFIPTEKQYLDFKHGKIDLYIANYTIFVEKIISIDFDYYENSMLLTHLKKCVKAEKKAV